MADEPIPRTAADGAIDAAGVPLGPDKEPRDGNGVANIPTPPEFSAHSATIPPTEELFSKQEDDVSNLILKLPQTNVPDFSVKLYRRRQLDWGRYKRAIGSTAGASEQNLPSPKTLGALQATASMGTLQFNRTVGYNYMRKSLALMYHQTSLMKTLNTNLVSLGKVLEAKLEAIKLNSATPESKKAGVLTKFKNEFRDQSIRASVMNLRGGISNIARPILDKHVLNPAAQGASDFFAGKSSLSDVAKDLQMGMRNATQTASEKLTAKPEDDAVDTPPANRVAKALSRLSSKIGSYSPTSKTNERLDSASNWIRDHLPSSKLSSFFGSFLGGDTPDGDISSSTSKEGASSPDTESNFNPETSPQTAEFYNDSRAYYAKSLAFLQTIAEGRTAPTPAVGRRKSEPRRSRPTRSPRPSPAPKVTPTHTAPTKPDITTESFITALSKKPSAFVREALKKSVSPSPSTPVTHTILPPRPTTRKLSGMISHVAHTDSAVSHPDEIIPPQHRRSSLGIHGPSLSEAVDADFSTVSETPKNSRLSSLRDDLRRYASATTSLLSGFMKHDKTISDTAKSLGVSFDAVKDTLLKFVPKQFRKNSYDEEVSKDNIEEKTLHDRASKTADETAGSASGGIVGLLKHLFSRKPKSDSDDDSGDSDRHDGSTLAELADIADIATDAGGVKGFVAKHLAKSRLGRAALKTAGVLGRPLSGAVKGLGTAASVIKNKGVLRGGLSLTGSLIKSPFKALAAVDRHLIKPVDVKAMTALGSMGKGLGSLAKGALFSKGGLIGLGGLAVNNLTDHVTAKGSFMNRMGHTTGNAMEWGATGAMLGSFIAPGVGTAIGAGLGVAASTLITNLDLLGKGINATGRGLKYLYHGIVGEKPVIDPNGKLLKPGKAGLLSGLAFASQYTQEQLLGKQKAVLGFDPNAKPWVNKDIHVTPYENAARATGVNASSTLFDPTTLKKAYSGSADGGSATLNNQKVTDQKGYQEAYKLLTPDIQKKVENSQALQLTLWGTSIVNGPTDTAKIFTDNFNPADTEATYIRKIYQTRSTRFGGKSGADRQKAFQELGQESEYANAVSSGATSFSFDKANSILGSPVKPLVDGSGDMSALTASTKISGSVSQRANHAISFFKSKGWTTAQAAGIVGNLIQESGVNPQVRPGDNGTAFGIAQWHSDRLGPIQAAFGKPVTAMSLDEQLEAVNWELHNTEKGAGKALKSTTDADSAGKVVSRLYERPGNNPTIRAQEAFNRGGIATKILTAYADPSASSPQNTLVASASPNTVAPAQAASSPDTSTPTQDTPSPIQTASASPTNGVIANAPVGPSLSPTFVADASKPDTTPTQSSFVKSVSGPVVMRTADNGPSEVDKIRKGEFVATADKELAGKAYNPNSKAGGYLALAENQAQSDGLNKAITDLTKQIAANTEASNSKKSGKGDTLVVNQKQSNSTVHMAHNDLDLSKPGTKALTI